MAAGNYSFTIEQGATTDFEVVYKDSDGNPVDLSGYQARMHLRKSADEATTYLVLSSSLQRTTIKSLLFAKSTKSTLIAPCFNNSFADL